MVEQDFHQEFILTDIRFGRTNNVIRTVKTIPLLIFILAASTVMSAQSKYVGKSECDPQLKWGPGSYSIRLDAAQYAYLVAHTVGKNMLLIIKRQSEKDSCGMVRDAVASRVIGNAFEFACIDHAKPSAVVVGTRPEDDPHVSGKAVQGWLIDTKSLRFIPDIHLVVCRRSSFSGSDEGEDLVTIAKTRNSNVREK